MESGFKRIESEDEVFFNEHGFNYFIVSKPITSNAILDWSIHTKEVTLSIFDDNYIEIKKRKIQTLDELTLLLMVNSESLEEK
jgi:hypothetical protein